MRQLESNIKRLEPIKHMLLGMNESNHMLALWRLGNMTKIMCERLKIPYGTYTSKLIIRTRRGGLMYKSYHTHGRKSITSTADDPERRESNMKLILKRHLRDMAGDCILMCKAHVHRLLVLSPTSRLYMADDGDEIEAKYTIDLSSQNAEYIHPDHRWYVCTGSFLRLFGKGFSGYAEHAEYPPMELGFAVARIRNGKFLGVDKVVV